MAPELAQGEEVKRCLFVSVLQDPPTLSSRSEIVKLIEFAKRSNTQILFVQIYRSNQTWFPSRVGDASPYENALKNLSEDPFDFLIRKAHASGIEVHAWCNLLSLGANENSKLLKKYGPEILTRNLEEKKTLQDYMIDNQYFLEPGDLRVRRELGILVEEILTRYPALDGIQFDYIRYPDSHPFYGYTDMNVERFKLATGLLTINEESPRWRQWRRDQVTQLLRGLVWKARSLRPGIQVSATGCAPYSRAYHEAYQDWPSWINSGLVDFVTVMTYPPDMADFMRYISVARTRVDDWRKMYIGVGAYKLTSKPEIFAEQFAYCENSGAGACAIFHYGSLLENRALMSPLTGVRSAETQAAVGNVMDHSRAAQITEAAPDPDLLPVNTETNKPVVLLAARALEK